MTAAKPPYPPSGEGAQTEENVTYHRAAEAALVASTEPPLTCAYCHAPRWNDESVNWLPLRGDHRLPYCAGTCAVWVMTPASAGDDRG